MGKRRAEIDDRFKWNIEDMYPSEEVWDKDLERVLVLAEEYAEKSGTIGDSAGNLLAAFSLRDDVWRLCEHVFVYARMRRDEDNADAKYQAMTDKSQTLMAKVSAATSFFVPEFIQIPSDKLEKFLAEEPKLRQYDYVIKRLLREKAHVLSESEELLLAKLGEVLGATGDIFTMINDADMKFGEVTDEGGNKVELTHGNYIKLLESKNRKVRQEAYEKLYQAFIAQKNTLATTYSYNTKVDVISAGIRKYESALSAALSGDNVEPSVYDNLISTVRENLPVVHKYMGTRKRLLGEKKLAMYDVYVPLTPVDEEELCFDEAVGIIAEALAPLGKEYVDIALGGIRDGWVDVYENEGKSSGAYSFGSYDSMPYILMNFSGKMKDVFTLIHEMGHSMHSYYTRKAQPFTYGSHSIFTAEVASTVNENLLISYLLSKADEAGDLSKKTYYVNFYIEEFRTTLVRQTMFAEFEKRTHEATENGEVLTCEYLSEIYGELNEAYFGSEVETDDFIRMEWSRIPHFYRAFYVYKYATGFSAASAISSLILTKGQPAVDDYLEFLKSGDSNDPIELLKIAGVDMGKPEPITDAMKVFSGLVDEFDKLTQ
ncbi:MAG: oligoendopeptidase F [Clostridiales Family XIII bacterium]|nr:oligoendopeptidase F [Clostridiales Family XIII bacterium]